MALTRNLTHSLKTFSAVGVFSLIGCFSFDAHAGFQWVPSDGQTVNTAPMPAAPPPAAPPAYAPAPVYQPPVYQPAAPAPAPVSAYENDVVLPLPTAEEIAPPSQSMSYQNNTGPVALVPPPPPAGSYEPATMPEPAYQPPVYQPAAPTPAPVPFNPPPVPAYTSPASQNVVLPDDAPRSARLKIAAFPDEQDLEMTDDMASPEPMPMSFMAPIPNTPPPAAAIGAPAPAPAVNSMHFAESVGFGSDVPLALALRQVVPPEFSFSFASSVNPGFRVSWDGGKPWNEVVDDMIRPLGYGVQIQGRTVLITGTQTSMAQDFAPISTAAGTPSIEEELALPDPFGALEPAAGHPNAAPEATAEVQPLFLLSEENEPIVQEDVIFVEEARVAQPVSQNESKKLNVQRVNVVDPGQDVQISQPQPSLDKITRFKGTNFYEQPANAPAVEVKPQAALEPIQQNIWRAESGESLKDTLSRWSTDANAQLVWDARYDYTLSSDVFVKGSFEDAVDSIISAAIQESEKPDVEFVDDVSDARSAQLYIKDRG